VVRDNAPATGPPSWVSRWYLLDGLGSTRSLVDDSGFVQDGYRYDAFGTPTTLAGGSGFANAFLFNGQVWDDAVGGGAGGGFSEGLYFLRARYYGAGTGRFLSQDPFEGHEDQSVTLHRYLYSGSDPVGFMDPGGEDFSLVGLSAATSIHASLANIQSGIELQVKQNIYDTLFYGPEIAIKNLQIASVFSIGTTALNHIFPDIIEFLPSGIFRYIGRGVNTLASLAGTVINASSALEEVYDLHKQAVENGVPDVKKRSLALLKVDGEEDIVRFSGQKNGPSGIEIEGAGQSNMHAEGNCIRSLAEISAQDGHPGFEGKTAVLVVNNPLCGWCEWRDPRLPNSAGEMIKVEQGVLKMAKYFGLREITVISPIVKGSKIPFKRTLRL
jgi:RHS repeat-associated protein